jgi:hypothetical protein
MRLFFEYDASVGGIFRRLGAKMLDTVFICPGIDIRIGGRNPQQDYHQKTDDGDVSHDSPLFQAIGSN